jgi:DHA1 family tetracycline resistance protein-like MFS transporter
VLGFQGGDSAGAANWYGWFAAAFAGMQFLCSPLLGALSDRFGRRPVVLLSNLGLGLDYIVMALAPNLWVLFAGRVFAGMTSASIATANAYIADVTPAEKSVRRRLACWALHSDWDLSLAQPWVACWAASISVCRSGWQRA